MRVATLALMLFAAPAFAQTYALGVGASKANEVIVRIGGETKHVRLDGVPDASDAARDFLQCLVAGRVVRVDAGRGRVTMLDGNTANDHVLEYLQTKTKVDPCALGKAAYTRGGSPAAAPAPAAADTEPTVTSEPLPQPAAKKPAAKKPKKRAKS